MKRKVSQKLKKAPARKPEKTPSGEFKHARGGRKTATAQVRIFPGQTGFTINNKDYKNYFPYERQQLTVLAPLEVADMKNAVGVTVIVKGGGFTGQAEAIRHGLAAALASHDPDLRKKMKREGYLTRDPRAVERKKYGLKKARRAPQWSKR